MSMTQRLYGIRIARISTVPFFVVAQLKHQIATLGAQGAQVTVVASDEPEMALLQGLEGVRCVPIDIPRSISPWRDLIALVRLYRFLRRERIQIAHSTTPKAGLLTALAAFLAGVPVRLHTFTGQPWVDMRGAKRWLTRASDRLIGILNTRCYADSASQRKFLIEQGIADASRLFCIGAGSLAGVDVQRFDPNCFLQNQRESMRQLLGIPSAALVLLFVGRITVDKGVRELLEAFQRLKATGNGVHLVLVGSFDTGSGVAGSILLSQIDHLSDVHVVGYTDSPESYLSIADILCLPSYREGFGTVVIEAAAMGVPTVGTEIYGLSDAVVHGETGLLVPPRNVEELTGCLEKLLADKLLMKKMGEAARQRALTLFDARKVNRQLVDEYCNLLRKKRMME
ncbi:MAG: glycosyltransferase family 1 protein [Comamonadaceae bacterium CG12_big_fil_rev_8_21_14_0_65_59_15]|nr:MAG: glycosyltransferase family 1 protein [Comamonadaceae bacterium CG12_big_fil_rev_8_21_14_0_65_59_15]